MRTYELTLRSECGYGGAHPYVSTPFTLLCLFDPILQLLGLGTGCRRALFVCFPIFSVFVSSPADADTPFRIRNSPVFDPITGFGGDGVPGTYSLPLNVNFTSNKIQPTSWKGCVGDGPFKDYILHFGPGKLVTDHCLTRDIGDDYDRYLTSAAMANATQQPTFELFRVELEGIPYSGAHKMHDSGHLSVSGEMSNYYSSPGGGLRQR